MVSARPAEPESIVDRRYRLRRLIARGERADVHEALQTHLLSTVAIKLLHEDARREPIPEERLLREGRALVRARHPNVVAVLDAGRCDRHGPFLVTERLVGRALSELLAARSRLSLTDALVIVTSLADALHNAHRRGVVHRDVHPGNVVVRLRDDGREVVTLVGFGFAQLANDGSQVAPPRITHVDDPLGSDEYVAPEQLFGLPLDPRADQYALAVVFYECLTGAVPFSGCRSEIGDEILGGRRPTPLPALRGDVSPEIGAVVERALAASRDERHPTTEHFAAALLQAHGRPLDELSLLEATLPAGVHHDGASIEPPRPRREHRRRLFVSPAELVRGDGSAVAVRTADLARGGCLVSSRVPLTAGESVLVHGALPTSTRPLAVPATVRWSREGRSRWVAGLRFDALDPDALAEIDSFCDGTLPP